MPLTIETLLALGYHALLNEPPKNIMGRVIGDYTAKIWAQVHQGTADGKLLTIKIYPSLEVDVICAADYTLRRYKTDAGFLKCLESHGIELATVLLRKITIDKILKDL